MLTPEREAQIRFLVQQLGATNTEARELLTEIDRLRAVKQISDIDRLNLESADHRYEFLYQVTREEIDELTRQRDQLREKLAVAEDGLKFYAGETHESEWDGCKFLTFDKFGCLDAQIAGPYIAKQTLNYIRGEKV